MQKKDLKQKRKDKLDAKIHPKIDAQNSVATNSPAYNQTQTGLALLMSKRESRDTVEKLQESVSDVMPEDEKTLRKRVVNDESRTSEQAR